MYNIYIGDLLTVVDDGLTWDQYRWESIYRYSGLLYDKLKCLFSYNYRNVMFYTPHSNGEYLYRVRCRFYTRLMCLETVEQIATEYDTTNGLDESVAQSLNFINS